MLNDLPSSPGKVGNFRDANDRLLPMFDIPPSGEDNAARKTAKLLMKLGQSLR